MGKDDIGRQKDPRSALPVRMDAGQAGSAPVVARRCIEASSHIRLSKNLVSRWRRFRQTDAVPILDQQSDQIAIFCDVPQ